MEDFILGALVALLAVAGVYGYGLVQRLNALEYYAFNDEAPEDDDLLIGETTAERSRTMH